jgi:hypothetical protein
MGVEPTGAGIANARTVLKTGEATRPLPPPLLAASFGGSEFSIAGPPSYACAITRNKSRPYFSTLAGPKPGTAARAARVVGRVTAMLTSVLLWATT